MNTLIYWFAHGLIVLIQALPLDGVARLGRFLGGLVYWLDARHRRVARRNLAMCFPEKSRHEIRALTRENFKRIGESFLCPIKLAVMPADGLWERLELAGAEKLIAHEKSGPPRCLILAIGHFGSFELFARLNRGMPSHKLATTYRAIRNPGIDRLLLGLRQSTDCLYFERRGEGAALRAALRGNNILLGLLADQHSGEHGLRLPFLGHDCNTSKAPAVFALRFEAPLHHGICYRTRLGHWRIEMGDEIPTRQNGEPRSLADIMLDVNRAFEVAVRRDPANWFWVHNRWKQSKIKTAVHSSRADDEDESPASIEPRHAD